MANLGRASLCTLGLLLATAGCEREHAKQELKRGDTTRGGGPAFVSGTDGAAATPVPAGSVRTSPAPTIDDPMKGVDDDMGAVLAELQALGPKPLATLSAAEARQQPSPADAVKALLKKQGKSTAPEAIAKVQDRTIAGPQGTKLPVRLYTPSGSGAMPIVLYFHGGGFVIATNDTYDATPRALANGAHAIVVSVEYRKAPEHKFPAAHDDALAAYRWVTKNAASFGGDPDRIAVAGESAGGNLAANVAIAARDQKLPQPIHLLLVYPVATSAMTSDSYAKYREAKPLDKESMVWFTSQYFRSPEDASDPRINLVDARLTGLPSTTIINAEIDPLRSGAELLADKLRAAEVPVEEKTYGGVTHEFFGMGAVVSDAKDAMKLACDRLQASFDNAARRDVGGT